MENLLFFRWQNNISLEGDWFRLWSSGGCCSIYPSHLPDKTVLTLKRPSGCNWLFSRQLPKSSVHVTKILRKWKWKSLGRVRLFATPWTPWDSPGQSTGVGSLPFSRGSSQPRDGTQAYRIAGRFFTSWATREAQEHWSGEPIPSPSDLPNTGT